MGSAAAASGLWCWLHAVVPAKSPAATGAARAAADHRAPRPRDSAIRAAVVPAAVVTAVVSAAVVPAVIAAAGRTTCAGRRVGGRGRRSGRRGRLVVLWVVVWLLWVSGVGSVGLSWRGESPSRAPPDGSPRPGEARGSVGRGPSDGGTRSDPPSAPSPDQRAPRELVRQRRCPLVHQHQRSREGLRSEEGEPLATDRCHRRSRL